MTAHVAQAVEDKGRVILRCSEWAPNDAAIDAALLVANAFQSEVELLFVEDAQRVHFAEFPFATEFSLRGGKPRLVSASAVRAEMRGAFANARRRVAAKASEREVHVYEHVVRDDPIQALVSACARRGPWNMIAIAETFDMSASRSLDELFGVVTDATGVIIAGSAAGQRKRSAKSTQSGPVVLAVEDGDHLQGMVRAGRHIATALDTDLVVLIVAGTDQELARIDAEVRLVLTDQSDVLIAATGITYDDPAAVTEAVRRLRCEFLVAQYGGVAVPHARVLPRLTSVLQCPVLLVR